MPCMDQSEQNEAKLNLCSFSSASPKSFYLHSLIPLLPMVRNANLTIILSSLRLKYVINNAQTLLLPLTWFNFSELYRKSLRKYTLQDKQNTCKPFSSLNPQPSWNYLPNSHHICCCYYSERWFPGW